MVLNIVMDKSEFAESDLTEDELRNVQKCLSGKYHDFFLKPRDDDT